MQSNTPASTVTTGGLNIRADRATREARSATGQEAAEWPELVGLEVGRQLEKLNDMLQVESKILDGAELMLEAQLKEPLRRKVESTLDASKARVSAIQKKIDQLTPSRLPPIINSSARRKATGGLTFINGTGLPSTTASLNTPNNVPNALSLVPGVNGVQNDGPKATNGNSDISTTRRTVTPHAGRTRSEDAGEAKEDYRTALSQARGLSRALASLAAPDSRANTNGMGDTSPPPAQTSLSSTNGKYDLVDPTNQADLEKARMELMTSLVQILAKSQRVRWESDAKELIRGIIPSLSDNAPVPLRTAAYRLLRYVMSHPDGPDLFNNIDGKDLGWFVVRSLSRDNKHIAEKEQAFLLIRWLIDIGSSRRPINASAGCSSVPIKENIVRALVSIAEHEEDANMLRWSAVEMLAEIFLLDAQLVYQSEGIRVLLQTLADGPQELGPVLANVFLTIIDNPRTREYLKLGTDLEMGISGITDAYGRGESHVEAMKASAKVVVTLLRSWAGLMYLCTNNMLAIRALVDTLRVPSTDTREIVLDMFFEVLNIKPAEWYRAFLDGKRLTMYNRREHDASRSRSHQPEPTEASVEYGGLNLIDQYLALVLAVLTEAGLLDALICMVEEFPGSTSNLARKAVLLLGEVLEASNRLLPLSYAAKIQALPKLFRLASDFEIGQNRMVGTSTLSSIDSFNRNRSRLQPVQAKVARNRANSTDDSMLRGKRQIEQVKVKMALQLDDRTFQLMLSETQVTQTKDHTKWNYEILVELFEGPLLGPRRIEEALRWNKFGKKLMNFWHPSARRFSEVRKTKSTMRWIKLGCLILSTLLKTQEGAKFLLNEDDFLRDLSDSFAQIDSWNPNLAYDSIFTKKRLEETLSSGYLQMLGQLSKTPRGIELMEHFKFFNSFYHLSNLKFREDLIKEVIQNLDYTVDGHSRIVLSKALTASSYRHIRQYATEYLGNLILNSKQSNAWTLRLLLTQLYDPTMEVREQAVDFLNQACENPDVLRLVVDMQPTLDHLGELGEPLLLKFMSTAAGFQYLYDTEYIEQGMNSWFHERNQEYVILVEVYLARAFSTDPAEEDDEMPLLDRFTTRHFYGEIVKTELGCQILHDKGHFSDFTHFIRQHGFDSEDSDIILRLKSVLWAVGNIGASERGISFLEDDDIIPVIIEMSELSPVLSVRGTCFFVIGLIASTEQGAEILSDYGWSAATTSLGDPTGICVPEDIGKFMTLQPWETPTSLDIDRRLPPLKSQHERDVLEAIENLCNTVIANAASRTLAKHKSRADAKQIFSSILLLHRALHAMSTRRYRFPVRRYIIELFDIKLDESVLAELARYEKEAQEELMSAGGLLLNQRSSHSHGYGHHSHGSRRLRHSMRAKTRRRSNAEFRPVGGQEEDSGQLNGSGPPDSPMVVRAKADIQRVTGFDAQMDDGLANAMIMQIT